MEGIPDTEGTPLGAVIGVSGVLRNAVDQEDMGASTSNGSPDNAVTARTQVELANRGVFESLANMIEEARADDPVSDIGKPQAEDRTEFLKRVRKIRDCALIINSSIPSQVRMA